MFSLSHIHTLNLSHTSVHRHAYAHTLTCSLSLSHTHVGRYRNLNPASGKEGFIPNSPTAPRGAGLAWPMSTHGKVSSGRALSLFLSVRHLLSGFHEAFVGLCSGSEAHSGDPHGTGISRAECEVSCGGNQHPNNIEREEPRRKDSAGREGGRVCSAVVLGCRPSPGAHTTPWLPTITPLYSSWPWSVRAGLHTRVAFIELTIGRKKKEKANIHLLS